MIGTTAIRRLRIQRLLGTDETKGARGDLARAHALAAAGHMTAPNGKQIDEAIASLAAAVESYRELLAGLDES